MAPAQVQTDLEDQSVWCQPRWLERPAEGSLMDMTLASTLCQSASMEHQPLRLDTVTALTLLISTFASLMIALLSCHVKVAPVPSPLSLIPFPGAVWLLARG